MNKNFSERELLTPTFKVGKINVKFIKAEIATS